MTSKIEWYKEVLSLEPASKVFFPLARLYVEAGQTEEAAAVLRQGLERHPEHLEARFLLVELIAASGQGEEAKREADRLGTMLTGYPAFWRLWTPEAPEAAVTLRLLAMQLAGRPVSLAGLLAEGLNAFDGGRALSEAVGSDRPDSAPQTFAVVADEAPRPASLAVAAVAAVATGTVAALASTASQSATSDAALPEADAVPTPAGVETVERAAEPSFEFSLDEDMVVTDAAPASPGAAGEGGEDVDEELAWLVEDVEATAARSASLIEDAALDLSDENFEDDEETDGPTVQTRPSDEASLRTATMAELLAGQGDYAAALDIFRELLNQASPGEQRDKLTARVVEIEGQLGRQTPAAEPPRQERPSGEGKSKKKLLGVLETLAGRLESRAGSGS